MGSKKIPGEARGIHFGSGPDKTKKLRLMGCSHCTNFSSPEGEEFQPSPIWTLKENQRRSASDPLFVVFFKNPDRQG